VLRPAFAEAEELATHGATAVALTPGWIPSEMMLENFSVTEDTWRDGPPLTPISQRSESPRFVGR
jgi:hypothetical protein